MYQCLQCGQSFPGGSSELLKGCPGCGGTRFFFTQKPLDEDARREKEAHSKADLKNVLLGLLADEEEASQAAGRSWKEWLAVDPEAVKEAMEEIRQRAPQRQATLDEHADLAAKVRGMAEAQEAPQPRETPKPQPTVAEAPPEPETPENRAVGTVNVRAPGEYEIDVERLMEANPVVVEKDGVFMIHLASVFDTNREASRRAKPQT